MDALRPTSESHSTNGNCCSAAVAAPRLKRVNTVELKQTLMATHCLQFQQRYVNRSERAATVHRMYSPEFRGCTVWFTGLSSSGKTTTSFELERLLVSHGIAAFTLDGDNIRDGLNADLGFTDKECAENIRRVSEVAKLFAESGILCLCSFVSPCAEARAKARRVHEEAETNLRFFEVFVDTPIDECERRDVKGVYRKARDGSIPYKSVYDGYDIPERPDVRVNTVNFTPVECAQQVLQKLQDEGVLPHELRLTKTPNAPPLLATQLHGLPDVAATRAGANGLSVLAPGPIDITRLLSNAIPQLEVTRSDLQWINTISEGWAYPLKGFMRETEYLQCLHCSCISLHDGQLLSMSVPIVLAVTTAIKTKLQDEKELALTHEGKVVAVLRRPEFYAHNKEERCALVYGMNHERHGGVTALNASGDWLVGGDLQVVERVRLHDELDEWRISFSELTARLREFRADSMAILRLETASGALAQLTTEALARLHARGASRPAVIFTLGSSPEVADAVTLLTQLRALPNAACALPLVLPWPALHAGVRETLWFARTAAVAGVRLCLLHCDTLPTTQLNSLLKAAPGLTSTEFLTLSSQNAN